MTQPPSPPARSAEGVAAFAHSEPTDYACVCPRCKREPGPHAHHMWLVGLDVGDMLQDFLYDAPRAIEGQRVRVTIEVVEEPHAI